MKWGSLTVEFDEEEITHHLSFPIQNFIPCTLTHSDEKVGLGGMASQSKSSTQVTRIHLGSGPRRGQSCGDVFDGG